MPGNKTPWKQVSKWYSIEIETQPCIIAECLIIIDCLNRSARRGVGHVTFVQTMAGRLLKRTFSSSPANRGLFSSVFGSRAAKDAEPQLATDAIAPKYEAPMALARRSRHRPPTEAEVAQFRRVSDGQLVSSPADNPGARIHMGLLAPAEIEALEGTARDLCKSHGIDLIDPYTRSMYEMQMSFLRVLPPVNMLRVTGRPENERQRKGEWGYGDDFDPTKLPDAIRTLVERIQNIPGLALGKPRDITINQRKGRFYRLDPHLDPKLDGGSIFIYSLTAGTVITLSPLDYWKEYELYLAKKLANDPDWKKKGLEWFRSTRSYTPEDLDVLAPLHSAVQLSDDARWTWTHATRLGMEAEMDEKGKKRWRLADWWGSPDRIIPRSEERISVIVAFGDA